MKKRYLVSYIKDYAIVSEQRFQEKHGKDNLIKHLKNLVQYDEIHLKDLVTNEVTVISR